MSFNIPKGTKDVLPEDSYKWHYIEDAVRETTRLFDVKEIRTPTFEHTELFLRGVGDTTDIVNKEMYTFFDKGNRSITLKPEGTAGVARCFVENSLYAGPLPVKTYYITPVSDTNVRRRADFANITSSAWNFTAVTARKWTSRRFRLQNRCS